MPPEGQPSSEAPTGTNPGPSSPSSPAENQQGGQVGGGSDSPQGLSDEQLRQAIEQATQQASEQATQQASEQTAQQLRQELDRRDQESRQSEEEARRQEQAEQAPTALATQRLKELDEKQRQLEEQRQKLEQDRTEVGKLKEELGTITARERNSRRVEAARRMGLTDTLTDDQALKLIPDVDPETDEGRAQLDQWRERNSQLFERPRDSTPRVEDVMPEQPSSSRHGLYDREDLRVMLQRNLGG